MNPSYSVLTLFKVRKYTTSLWKVYFRLLGLKINDGGSFCKISCDWPNKISIGSDCVIEDKVAFKIAYPFSDDNYIKIGNRVFIGRYCELNCSSRILIGNDCMIASNTTFVDTGHEMKPNSTMNKQKSVFQEIVIGEDVWIGSRCVILKGVTIGKGSVIGAGSIVNKSIPEYEVWAGNPARFIRNRE